MDKTACKTAFGRYANGCYFGHMRKVRVLVLIDPGLEIENALAVASQGGKALPRFNGSTACQGTHSQGAYKRLLPGNACGVDGSVISDLTVRYVAVRFCDL